MTTFLRQVCILVQDLKPANQANLFDILDGTCMVAWCYHASARLEYQTNLLGLWVSNPVLKCATARRKKIISNYTLTARSVAGLRRSDHITDTEASLH